MPATPTLELLLSLISAHYSAYLTPEQLSAVRQGLERLEQTAQTLRAYPLSNADEPMAVFCPYHLERA
jgi:hypothetical protein